MENLTDIFLKSRGHKYLRKVPNGKGGYRYIYEEPSLKTTSVVTREQKYKQNGWDYNTPSTVEYANDPQRNGCIVKQLPSTLNVQADRVKRLVRCLH